MVRAMTELKPCPFCNGAAKVKTRQYHDDPEFHRISVECDECSAEHPVHHRVKTQQVEECQTDVATVWNERKGQFFLLNPHGHPLPNEERPFKVRVRLLGGEGRSAWITKSDDGMLNIGSIYTDIEKAEPLNYRELGLVYYHPAHGADDGFTVEEVFYG